MGGQGRETGLLFSGRASIWVEVQALSATSPTQRRGYFRREFQQRSPAVSVPGDAFAEVSEKATAKDVKVAMKLTQLLLTECETLEQPWCHAFVVIPQDPVYDRTVRFAVEGEEGLA